MLSARRTVFLTSCVVPLLWSAACGGSPTGPSGAGLATVAGTVNINAATALKVDAIGGAPAFGLTVSVVGTSLSTTVQTSGYFQIAGVPPGNVRLQFQHVGVDATAELGNVRSEELVEIEVQISGDTANIVSEVRTTEKVSLCHRTDSGAYHLISVSDSAEPAHRAHGDAKIGEPVPAQTTQTFDDNCRAVGPAIDIEKSTNGEDADQAPGPTLLVGTAVEWKYVVTNTGTIALTAVGVVDDRGVVVSCPGNTLSPGQSMTCTGTGAATLGQYSNVGTVTAASSSGSVTDSDASHYLGVEPREDGEDGPKVELCHKTGNGSYHLISVSTSAEPAHRAHGDGKIGEAVPGNPGKVFGAGCAVR